MHLRGPIKFQPGNHPNRAESPCSQERNLPIRTIRTDDERNDQWRQDRAKIRAGIEDTSRKRALFFRKPLSNCFDAGREISSFAKSQAKPREHEARQTERGPDRRVENPK